MNDLFLKHRKATLIAFHAALFIASYWLAFSLRFDFAIPDHVWAVFFASLPAVILIKIVVFDRFDLYQGWFRYVGMKDLSSIVMAGFISAVALSVLGYFVFRETPIPRSVPILDFVLVVGLVGGFRFAIRALREGALTSWPWSDHQDRLRVLIVGAGDAGEALVREVQKRPELNYHVVGYLDDSVYKQDLRIHGRRVLGSLDRMEEVCERFQVEEIFLALPSATREQMKRVLDLCGRTGLPVRTIPGLDQLIDGQVTVQQLREVRIEDLLGREPVELDRQAIGDYLHGKKVLVTGAAGSIGSEICRQVLSFGPRGLILVDHYENGIFEMGCELKNPAAGAELRLFVADVTDERRMRFIFEETGPEVVFHAAAYKHVPVMEENPVEAVKNNVGGSKIVADLCHLAGVKRVVMVSTDKAINPTSIMGATKRIAERYMQHLSAGSRTKFITVRFGNVLDSAGSVIPIFKKQIEQGGPVTVTHPEMRRFFMTIPEAVQLVLQAGSMGGGGEIFVLDMGEPVRIVELAETLIKLSGFTPYEDIKIEFTGMRPGEKLFEELYLESEHHTKTYHPKVFTRNCADQYPADFDARVEELLESADLCQEDGLKAKIAGLVPEYRGLDDDKQNGPAIKKSGDIKPETIANPSDPLSASPLTSPLNPAEIPCKTK